jgi:CO/xanthine dehydrogenase FAD-binding subunit
VLLPRFEYRHASSLLQAATLLAENPDARALAGGTDLLVDLRERRQKPSMLVDIAELAELQGVVADDGATRIGGGVTVGELLGDPLVRTRLPALHAAARDFADYLTRNKATLGGNLANASPGADLVVPLLALDAAVVVAGPGGERGVPLDALLLGPRRTALRPGELIRQVLVPRHGGRQAWYKLGLKRGGAIAVVSVATWIQADAGGRVTEARIALGAVGPRPFRPREAEAALVGAPLAPDRIARAADLAAAAARPISDVRGSSEYRTAMVRTLVAGALGASPMPGVHPPGHPGG